MSELATLRMYCRAWGARWGVKGGPVWGLTGADVLNGRYSERISELKLQPTLTFFFKTSPELRRLLRKLESTSRKLINTNWSITFNDACLKEYILPNIPEFVKNKCIF